MELNQNQAAEPDSTNSVDSTAAVPAAKPKPKIHLPLDEIPASILEMSAAVSVGKDKHDKKFIRYGFTVRTLLEHISSFRRGKKDGDCFTQGTLVSGRRLAKNVERNNILMIDCDTGETFAEVEAKVKNSGHCALIWTTYSHLKPQTFVPESTFLEWVSKEKHVLREDNSVDLMRRYLSSTGKVKDRILQSITHVSRKLAEGGVQYIAHHDPMHRTRVLFILKEPFEFVTEGVRQDTRIAEWSDKYRSVSDSLGLAYDRSCVDPSRLMFMPAMSPDANAGDHEIRWIDGNLLDLGLFPCGVSADHTRTQASKPSPAKCDFKTPGLNGFLSKYGSEFNAACFLRDVAPDDIRSDTDGKVECMCPNDEAHSDAGNPDDRAFFATDSVDRAWTMGCRHDSCITAASINSSSARPDRAWYLDRACQKYGIEHADELKQWTETGITEVSRAVAEEKLHQKTAESLSAAVTALTPKSDNDAIRAALDLLATLEPDPMDRDDWLKRISKHTDRSKGLLEAQIKAAQARHRANRALGGELPSDEISGDLRAACEEFNKVYAVTNVSGKACITYVNDEDRIEFMSKSDFELMHANNVVWTERRRVPVAGHWLGWTHRSTFDGVQFNPSAPGDYILPGSERRIRNYFRGFTIKPQKGNWSLFRRHLFEVVCRRDPYHFAWLWSWYASIFRDPSNKPGTAVVLRGAKGTGKSKVFEIISQLCPNNALVITKKEHALGKFNAHLAECLIANVEEAFWAGDKAAEGTLKEEITGRVRPVEPKGQNMFMINNCTRYQFNSNEHWVVPASSDERRWFVLDVSPERMRDYDWFAAIDQQMRDGGLEAMMDDFLEIPPPSFINLREAPRTRGLLEQIERSLSVEHRWLRHVLESGKVVSTGSLHAEWSSDDANPLAGNGCRVDIHGLAAGSVAARREHVYESFQEWCSQNHRGKHIPSPETLGRFLSKEGVETARPGTGDRKRCYVFPPLPELRATFAARHGVIFDDTDETTGTKANTIATADELEGWRAYGAGETDKP